MRIEQIKKEDEKAVLAGIVAFEFGLFEAAIKQAERFNDGKANPDRTAHSA